MTGLLNSKTLSTFLLTTLCTDSHFHGVVETELPIRRFLPNLSSTRVHTHPDGSGMFTCVIGNLVTYLQFSFRVTS